MKEDLCDPILLLVKTVGPEVFRGNFDCAGEQNYRSHLGVGFFAVLPICSPNLAASLDARKRFDEMSLFQKKKGVTRTFISPRVRSDPLWSLGSDVTRDRTSNLRLYSRVSFT